MPRVVERSVGGYRVRGAGGDVELVTRFLADLGSWNFSAATVRAYVYDLLNFLWFAGERGTGLAGVTVADVFDYLDWQARPLVGERGSVVVRLADRRGAAPATMNRWIAAARGLFAFMVMTGLRETSPVPSPRRASGMRAAQGLLGHVRSRRPRQGGRLVRE